MKNKTYLPFILLLCANVLLAQSTINKEIANANSKTIVMDFNRASAKIIAWDKNNISIKASVNINNGDNDDSFEIDIKEGADRVSIKTFVKDIDELPKMIVITNDGEKHYFRDNAEGRKALKAFKKEKGKNYNSWSEGVHTEIDLEIYVPQNAPLRIESLYGSLDLENISSTLEVDNTYGYVNVLLNTNKSIQPMNLESTYNFVDVSLPASAKLDVRLNSGYGEIYTDLDIQQPNNSSGRKNFGAKVNGTMNGGGTALKVEATYNNIYLRKM